MYFGLSMFTGFPAAADRARRCPALGSHIAQVHLEPGNGFHVAETGARVHRSQLTCHRFREDGSLEDAVQVAAGGS